MEKLTSENLFISDHLDAKGFKEGDIIQINPISGRQQKLIFKHRSMEFLSENDKAKNEEHWVKKLPCLNKEKFHVEISRLNTIGRQNASKERIVCRSLDEQPFLINGVLSFYAFLERGDEIKIGLNKLQFSAKESEMNFLEDKIVTDQVAKSDLLVLIQGETGTGKSRLAYEIHKQSMRKGDFVHLNLSAYPPSLLESELFGHVKGAFTGAHFDKKGAFESAMHGTLFLDEIDSLTLEMQTKLLLFLDDKKFRPLGQVNEKQTNARIIISSGRELKSLVATSKMRKDFYFRLASGHLTKLKPLREDEFLIERFCEKFSIEQNLILSPKLVDFYKTLPWPGNYRQLKNHLLKKKVYTNGRKLEFDNYDEMLLLSSTDLKSLAEREERILTMKEMKEVYVRNTYARFQNNLSYTAKILGLSPKSVKKIIQYNY